MLTIKIEYDGVVGGLNIKFMDGVNQVAFFQTQSDILSTWNQLNILNFIRDGILLVKESK